MHIIKKTNNIACLAFVYIKWVFSLDLCLKSYLFVSKCCYIKYSNV